MVVVWSTRARRGGHLGPLSSLACVFGVIGIIRGSWVFTRMRPWGRWVHPGSICVRRLGHWVHSASLGSLTGTLGDFGFIRDRCVR